MTLPFVFFFGLAPSIIWLLYFLKRDTHPESNTMILKIFFYGMMITVIAALIELGLEGLLESVAIYLPSFVYLAIYHLIVIALVEESLKYFIIRENVLKESEFDEPVDAMLYMIIAALGFAALENIFVLLPIGQHVVQTISISAIRFIGATFLHALCSGTIGYFLALSLLNRKKKYQLILTGIAISTFLHGLYNFSIMKAEDNVAYLFIPIILLTGLAFFVSFGFRRLKKMASVCKT